MYFITPTFILTKFKIKLGKFIGTKICHNCIKNIRTSAFYIKKSTSFFVRKQFKQAFFQVTKL